MKLGLTERQYKLVISEVVKNQEIGEQEEPVNPEPEAGTSSQQSGGQGYPEVGKWESGVTRGPANQVGVTKWSDVVGANLKRGKANPLKEQNDLAFDRRYGTAAAAEKSNRENRELVNAILNIDPHTRNMILGIASAFIPVVGPFIAAGIGLYDAKQYYDEGDTKTAGLIAMFSIMPGVGSIVAKIPGVKQLGTKGMTALASKLSMGTKITNPTEIEIVNLIGKNKQLIQQELNKSAKELSIRAAKNKVKNQIIKQNIGKSASKLGKGATKLGATVGAYGAATVGYNTTYDYFLKKQEDENLKILNQKLGLTN